LYSIDGVNFQENPLFNGLAAGDYTIYIINENDCQDEFGISIPADVPVSISSIDAYSTYCNEDNGQIIINALGSGSLLYSIDGVNFQNSEVFQNLNPGNYTITVIDENDCIAESQVNILPSPPLILNEILSELIDCNEAIFSLSIDAQGDDNLKYSIDGNLFQTDNTLQFTSAGTHTISVMDSFGCQIDSTFLLEAPPSIQVEGISVTAPECGETDGSFIINAKGGTGQLSISIDGQMSIPNGEIINLNFGDYEVLITDEFGCSFSLIITIPRPKCDVIVPNIISPNGDLINDVFQVFSKPWYEAGILEYYIFDRWGSLIYEAGNFTIQNDNYWWDGTFNNKPVVAGVFVYLIKVRHENSEIEILSGDVTVIR
jgi:gliding motility-associated-like protein